MFKVCIFNLSFIRPKNIIMRKIAVLQYGWKFFSTDLHVVEVRATSIISVFLKQKF